MDAAGLFLYSHARAHSARVVGEEPSREYYEDRAVDGLTEAQLRLRPHGLNSIALLLWHVARTEDVAANLVVAGRLQVLDSGGWAERLRVTRRDLGEGLTPQEVGEISEALDVPAVRAYRHAVALQTRALVQALPPEEWDRVVERSTIERAFAEGAFRSDAAWPHTFWGGRPVARLLSWPCLGHSLMHLGQAMWVRRLIEAPA